MSVSLKTSVGRSTTSFTIPLLLSCNSLLARILERDNAENFEPSGRFVVCGFGFIVSFETTESELLISTFGSSVTT
jgi:hypothetical protein